MSTVKERDQTRATQSLSTLCLSSFLPHSLHDNGIVKPPVQKVAFTHLSSTYHPLPVFSKVFLNHSRLCQHGLLWAQSAGQCSATSPFTFVCGSLGTLYSFVLYLKHSSVLRAPCLSYQSSQLSSFVDLCCLSSELLSWSFPAIALLILALSCLLVPSEDSVIQERKGGALGLDHNIGD